MHFIKPDVKSEAMLQRVAVPRFADHCSFFNELEGRRRCELHTNRSPGFVAFI